MAAIASEHNAPAALPPPPGGLKGGKTKQETSIVVPTPNVNQRRARFAVSTAGSNHGLATSPTGQISAAAGLVRETFYEGETPIGLVIDWTMPLPVISEVLPKSPAEKREALRYGLVLVDINGTKIRVGKSRAEVEQQLTRRPLELTFEAPDFNLIGAADSAAWRFQKALGDPKPDFRNLTADLGAATEQAFFSQFPERIPLSRWGKLEVDPLHAPMLPWSSSRDSKAGLLPMLGNSMGKSFGRSRLADTSANWLGPALSSPSRTGFSGHLSRAASDSGGRFAATWSGRQSFSVLHSEPQSVRTELPTERTERTQNDGTSTPGSDDQPRQPQDTCYARVVENGHANGPPPAADWPLGHDRGHTCRLVSSEMVEHVRKAYEPGFRGYKLEPPRDLDLRFPELAPAERKRHVSEVYEVSCDVCGKVLGSVNQSATLPFYFCRECKSHGHRFEMCTACHAMTVLQSEGKHVGKELHPHFLRCEHIDLRKFRDLRSAYPGQQHLRMAFCDNCGGRVGKARSEIYVCQRCPPAQGLRFELCAKCAQMLSNQGHGINRLRCG